MKRMAIIPVLLGLLLLFCGSSLADTTYDNFNGYQAYWHPLGYPQTSTYGETFTAPTNGDNVLQSFSFYLAGPWTSGDVLMSAYVATWTGTHAGTLLYKSSTVDYANTGNAQLMFSTGGLVLAPGGSYVAFLSISEYYGLSAGQSYVSQGLATIPGGNFVWYNNFGDFNALFNSDWVPGQKPDWAVTADFSAVPEPGSMLLLGSGLIGLAGAIRRRVVG